MNATTSQFRKGYGVYACSCCGRQTRHVECQLCGECYEMGGIENQGSDEGWTEELKTEWSALNEKLAAKGGKKQEIPW